MKKLFILFILCFFTASISLAQKELKTGDQAYIKIDKLLQSPRKSIQSIDELKGKVVILEFWATWCGPCVAAFQHLNELKEKFKDSPLEIISITSEEDSIVKKCLSKNKLTAWLGFDKNKKMYKKYNVPSIPHTIIIDKTGKIAAITSPWMVTDESIEKLINGEKINIPEKEKKMEIGNSVDNTNQEKVNSNIIFKSVIYPSLAGFGSLYFSDSVFGNRRLLSDGMPLAGIISKAYDINPINILEKFKLPKAPYAFDLIVPKGNENRINDYLKELIIHSFNLKIKVDSIEKEVKVLKRMAGGMVLPPSNFGDQASYCLSRGLVFKAVNQPISSLCSYLTSNFNKFVVNESGLTEKYDIQLKLVENDLNSLTVELAKYGLEVVDAKRKIQILVVEKDE
jgi:uncharacterized protein (TIGR03435 family)